MGAPKFQYLWRPEASGRPGARVTGGVKKTHMGAKSQTLVLCKIHLSSPLLTNVIPSYSFPLLIHFEITHIGIQLGFRLFKCDLS